jgi:hypothetical protein
MGLRALRATCLGAVLSTAACDFTEPQWEVDLILPFNSDTIALEDVLPPGITIGEIEGELAFIIPAIADSTSFTLGAACGSPCSTLQGQTVPVPGFAFVDTLDIALGSTLLSIEIRDGTISYMIRHDLGFDPLRPHADPDSAGSITLVTSSLSTGELLDSTVISGATATFPSGQGLQGNIDLEGKQIDGGTRTILTLDSPFDGQTAIVDTAASLTASAALLGIFVDGINVVVDSDTLRERFTVDLPPEIRERLIEDLLPGLDNFVQAARLVIEIQHGINISGGLDLALAADTTDLFSGNADEVLLENIDFSTAPNGRTEEREISPEDVVLIAEAEELFVGYEAVVSGTGPGFSVRLLPGDGVLIKLTISAKLRLQP